MRAAITPGSPAVTLTRRRLALCAVAAVVALGLGYFAAKILKPAQSHTASIPSVPAVTPPAAANPTPTSPGATVVTPAPAPVAGGVSPPASAAGSATGSTLPTALPMVSVVEAQAGFRISYPRIWTRLRPTDPSVPLLLSSRDGVSLQIQAVQFAKAITGPRLAALRDATGLLIRRQPGVQIIAGPRLLASASLPGFLYIYSFFDRLSHRRVAHSQISLFAGRRMFTLVFQTARAGDLPRFAMLFDKVTASFRAL